MASEFQDWVCVLDKVPDGFNIKLRIDVKYSWKFKFRVWVGILFMRLAAWVMNVGIEVEREEVKSEG
jgi:hypothetical protein